MDQKDQKQKITDKLKEGVSVKEIEDFAKKYTSEVFSALAIFIATVSSLFDFFTGAGWSVLFAGLGAITGLIFPNQVDAALEKFYSMVKRQEKPTQFIIGTVKLVIAIFIPFVLFCLLGLIGGTSKHIHSFKDEKPPSH